MNNPAFTNAAALVGRILIALIFVISGLYKIGGFSGVVQFPPSYASQFAARVWMHAMVTALCIGLGWFILWSKRREPRAAPKPKPTGTAAG